MLVKRSWCKEDEGELEREFVVETDAEGDVFIECRDEKYPSEDPLDDIVFILTMNNNQRLALIEALTPPKAEANHGLD